MVTDAWVVAPLVLAAVLAVSGWAKRGDPQATLTAMASLQVPEPLRRPAIAAALPWGELALAAALLITWGWVFQVTALAALALTTTYLVLVVAALRRGDDAECGCFGELASARVTSRTAARNTLLLVAALATVAGAFTAGATVGTLLSMDADGWLWLATLAAVVALLLSFAEPPSPAAAAGPPLEGPPTAADEDADYLRTPIPFARLATAEGTQVSLRELARTQARLLIFLSPTCGACTQVAREVPAWTERLAPAVAVHPVFRRRTVTAEEFIGPALDRALFQDEDASTEKVFEVRATPSAVLLGADGLVAGGPVTGGQAVPDFVDDILAQLAGTSAAEA